MRGSKLDTAFANIAIRNSHIKEIGELKKEVGELRVQTITKDKEIDDVKAK